MYAFEFVANDAHAWVQRAKLTATDGEPGDGFGASVAMFDDERFVVVGAPGKNAAYVFERSPMAALPCFTASIAYSIWWMRPAGDQVRQSVSSARGRRQKV